MDPEMDSYPNLESNSEMDSLNLNPETAVKPADTGDWLGLKYSNWHWRQSCPVMFGFDQFG